MTVSISGISKNKDNSISLTGLNLNSPNMTVLMSGYRADVLYKSYSKLIFIIPKEVNIGIHTITIFIGSKTEVYFSNNIEIDLDDIRRSVDPLPVFESPIHNQSVTAITQAGSDL